MVKFLPVSLLAFAVLLHARRLQGPNAWFARYIAFGLFVCSMGDILLDWQEVDNRMFIPGLATFLVSASTAVVAYLQHSQF